MKGQCCYTELHYGERKTALTPSLIMSLCLEMLYYFDCMCTLIVGQPFAYPTNYTKIWPEQVFYSSLLPCENFATPLMVLNVLTSAQASLLVEEILFLSYLKLTGQELKNAEWSICKQSGFSSSWKVHIQPKTYVKKCMITHCVRKSTKFECPIPCWFSRETECMFTLMGEYHFRFWGGFLLWAFLGLGSKGSYSCSGIFTTAFFGFSSLAPSSVEPFPPQRTYRQHTIHECTTKWRKWVWSNFNQLIFGL